MQSGAGGPREVVCRVHSSSEGPRQRLLFGLPKGSPSLRKNKASSRLHVLTGEDWIFALGMTQDGEKLGDVCFVPIF